jgi:signal transduction histidine kinase
MPGVSSNLGSSCTVAAAPGEANGGVRLPRIADARERREPVIITAADGVIRAVNIAAAQMLRCSSTEIVGRHLACFLPAAFVAIPHGTSFFEAVRADGTCVVVDLSVSIAQCGADTAYEITVSDRGTERRRGAACRQNAPAAAPISFAPRAAIVNVADFDRRPRSVLTRIGDIRSRQLEDLEQQARRVAQALHDEVGQVLMSAHLALDRARATLPPAARDQLDDVKRSLDGVEDELRRVAHELRPRILDDIGLVAAIEFLAEGVQKRRRVAVSVDANIQRRLPQIVETSVYRLVQEALNNAGKHARASRIAIGLGVTRRLLRCTIQDDGVGFATSLTPHDDNHGLGLAGMHDRVETLGGSLEIDSTPGGGTRVTIVVPID